MVTINIKDDSQILVFDSTVLEVFSPPMMAAIGFMLAYQKRYAYSESQGGSS